MAICRRQKTQLWCYACDFPRKRSEVISRGRQRLYAAQCFMLIGITLPTPKDVGGGTLTLE